MDSCHLCVGMTITNIKVKIIIISREGGREIAWWKTERELTLAEIFYYLKRGL